jgi:hypothetical protein
MGNESQIELIVSRFKNRRTRNEQKCKEWRIFDINYWQVVFLFENWWSLCFTLN